MKSILNLLRELKRFLRKDLTLLYRLFKNVCVLKIKYPKLKIYTYKSLIKSIKK